MCFSVHANHYTFRGKGDWSVTQKTNNVCAIIVTLAGLSILTSLDTQAAVTYRTVARNARAAPGTGPDVNFSDFGVGKSVMINAAGQAAFLATLSGTGVNSTNDSGIWSEGSGALGLVVREGDAAPGTEPGVVYLFFGSNNNPVFNDAGQTAFYGSLTGPGIVPGNAAGIWSEGAGSLALVARSGDQAPGTDPGVVFTNTISSYSRFNDAGQVAFASRLTGPGVTTANEFGIWSEGGGSLDLVAREGDQAPGTALGVVYDGSLGVSGINGAGQVVLGDSGAGIWSGGTGALSLVAHTGDVVLGTGGEFNGFSGLTAINDAGQTAFKGFLFGPPDVDSTNDSGIWVGDSGSLNLVAREGDAAPGTGAGVVYGNMGVPVINGAGKTAFLGDLAGAGVDVTQDGNNHGIWSEGDGSLALVARKGDAAPGTGPGVVFGVLFGPQSTPTFSDPVMNGAGQIAFVGNITGAGVNSITNHGIWATDTNGVLTLIAREGDLFDIDDNPLVETLRTIKTVEMATGSGGEDGRPSSFNDAGQLVFKLTFTNGVKGIYVATIPPGVVVLPGDLNGDGFVGIVDLNIVLGAWNQSVPPGDPLADPSGDGFVGIADLNVVLGNWNAGVPPAVSATIPEPGTLAVFAVAGLVMLRRGAST
jgi:hypothetical protein